MICTIECILSFFESSEVHEEYSGDILKQHCLGIEVRDEHWDSSQVFFLLPCGCERVNRHEELAGQKKRKTICKYNFF